MIDEAAIPHFQFSDALHDNLRILDYFPIPIPIPIPTIRAEPTHTCLPGPV